ncbi:MAG: cytochrome C [Desulfuromonadales bacterium]|nr:cytochrome C [Desulfuromonadales bacterium]
MTRKVLPILTLLLAAGATLVSASVFEHRAHLEEYIPGTSCDSCHLADANSIVPDPKVCLDCHDQAVVDGVAFGKTKTHGPVWALNHRLEAQRQSPDCAACHQQDFCLDCHKAGFADEMGAFGNNMINVHRSDFHVSHPIAARSDQRLCASCHEANYCNDCHASWRFRNGDLGSPSHRRTFGLGFDDADFDQIHQPIRNLAIKDASLACDSCHLQSSVAPDFHSWSIGHAREARRSLATCQSCHPDGDVCLQCHSARSGASAFNPHPKDWGDMKNRLKDASNGRTCRKCH